MLIGSDILINALTGEGFAVVPAGGAAYAIGTVFYRLGGVMKIKLKFISKKSCFPPLGLLKIAAMLPDSWEKKLVDMTAAPLTDKDIQWADLVFISAMAIQRESVREVTGRCKAFGVKTVAGGPLVTCEYSDCDDVGHLLLGEGELTVPNFIEDLEKGGIKHMYSSEEWADLSWGLIMTIQQYIPQSIIINELRTF
ncbi:MAG: cobalamin-dependent protein [Clostridiales Family XIII bacterium]|nr:cobalamin-dependent protein [Clostridiales Family XIII bacterium]